MVVSPRPALLIRPARGWIFPPPAGAPRRSAKRKSRRRARNSGLAALAHRLPLLRRSTPMTYVDDNLLPSETVLHRARMSTWPLFAWLLLGTVLFVAVGVGVVYFPSNALWF